MIERVRAVLVTADDTILVIRRTKPGIPTYWVLPGGGVEAGDEWSGPGARNG
ncbi:NUDIX domain-containing protein [Streptomyces sp. NPDC085612]|uniref:NUDIX domain-containing protein n=1 Tax=Streptomyces sp. NPDC085612 TaxID=3365732 RepID=UPI0037D8283C